MNIPNISIPDVPFDWNTRHEQLAIYDSTNDELISSTIFDGITEMCLNSNNSKIYLHVPADNRINVLDRDGKILESITIIKPSNPDAGINSSKVQLSVEGIPFLGEPFSGEYPLHNKNKRHGFEIHSKLNKLYLTLEGKSKDFLVIFNLNY